MKRRSAKLSKKLSLYSSWPQLSNVDVHRLISKQIAVLLPETIDGYKCDQQTLSDVVLKASVEGRAIEGTCNDLETAPTGATIRRYLNEALSVEYLEDIERKLQEQLQADLPQRLWRKPLELAADFHDEPFYGKSEILRAYACRGEAHAGTTWFYRVATAYVIHKGIPYTLALTFVLSDDTPLDVLKRLLQQVKDLNLRYKCLYLDKGFCVNPLLDYLERTKTPAVVACAIRGKTGGTRALCCGRQSYFTQYTFPKGKYSELTTTMAVVRTYQKKKGKPKATWLLYVVVHVNVPSPITIRHRYRSRFGVETSYRCMRQTHATTTSLNPALRFFLLGLAFLLLNLWLTLRWHFCQVPRRGGRLLDKKLYELQRQCRFLARIIDQRYDAVSAIQALVTPLDP